MTEKANLIDNWPMSEKPATVEAYIQSFPPDVQAVLETVRRTIRAAAPDAAEAIAYGMPGYKLGGKPLVYFGGFRNHIGLYATPTGHAAFADELSKYKQGKGSVQFPLGEPLPLDLITRIVQFRVAMYEQSVAEREARFAALDRLREKLPDIPEDEVLADVAEAIEAVRNAR